MDDWTASDDILFVASVAAIQQFAKQYPEKEVCCFFFDCDEPRYGHLCISLDTVANNIRTAKMRERFAIENRQTNLQGENAWQWAKYQLNTPVLSAFNTNSGSFEFQEYVEVTFPRWVELAESGNYPKGAEHHDDYLESNARLVMWRVAERLVADGVFAQLKLASPFLLGYGIHDQDEVILRMLNWP